MTYDLQDYKEEQRQEARESMRDSLMSEFEMGVGTDDILKDMIENGDSEEMKELLGDCFDEHKEMMFQEYCDNRD